MAVTEAEEDEPRAEGADGMCKKGLGKIAETAGVKQQSKQEVDRVTETGAEENW